MPKYSSPMEWFQEKFCKNCKGRQCIKKGTGVYATGTDWQAKVPCMLSILILSEIERQNMREYKA